VALTGKQIDAARRHLRKADEVMREIIHRVGPVKLRLEQNRFAMLVRSIISQQISTSAARSIRGRLEDLLAPGSITPGDIVTLKAQQLRSVGLSGQKVSYIQDLAGRVHSGEVNLRQIGRLTDERVIERLTRVRGIGHWTAQMFLMFSLGRPDVFPHGDLGIRSAIRRAYGLDELPDRKQSEEIARPWHPHATIASWYLWRSLEN
jgi:DNA-3-methyladenine glycosylase II